MMPLKKQAKMHSLLIIVVTSCCLIKTTAKLPKFTFLVPRGGESSSGSNGPPPPPQGNNGNDDYYYERNYRGYNEGDRDKGNTGPDATADTMNRRDFPYDEQRQTDENIPSSVQQQQQQPPPYPYRHQQNEGPPLPRGPDSTYDRRDGGQHTPYPDDNEMYDNRRRQQQQHDPYAPGDTYGQNPADRQRAFEQQQRRYHDPTSTRTASRQQPPPNLPPPDLPDFGDADDLPPASYDRTTTILPASGVTQGNSPSDIVAGAPQSAAKQSSGLDLSQFDKDLIFSGLKRLYRKKILGLELSSKYGHFHSPPLSPSDFEAKPMVLLVGQYSVGKTSFIRYLLGRDFPGARIGPEPTTDRFTSIMLGDDDKIVPGAALCSQADRPYRGLSPFGNNFLSRFEGVEMQAPILQNITLVDTPGILSGQKQSAGRNYDYAQVMKWFIERADLIIIMFDAHKLDISDELKKVIELMIPHQDKIRVVLNKADAISTQQLMRVYGALMWSLGKVMMTPEVCRVFMSSFWSAPLKNTDQAALLNQEKIDLFHDISQLPQNAVMRRINELVKRARSVKVHAYIIHYLRKQLPYTWGKREKQRKLIGRLDREFVMCARRYELPKGDFPPLEPFRQALLEIKDLSEFPKLDKKMVKDMDKVFSVDIPNLLEQARQC